MRRHIKKPGDLHAGLEYSHKGRDSAQKVTRCSPASLEMVHVNVRVRMAAGLINSKVNKRKTLLLFAAAQRPLCWKKEQTIHHNCDLVSPCQQNQLNQLHKLSAVTRDA